MIATNPITTHLRRTCLTLGAGLMLASTGLQAAPQDPSINGTDSICSYTNNISSWGYQSARVSYPCGLKNANYPATTLTGGFINTKDQMYWLADHLTSQGFIVITMTPTNIFGTPPTWATAHKAGITTLKNEMSRSRSPIRGKVDLSKLGVMGFSMGGGGALLAAGELKTQIKTAVPLAPFLTATQPNYPAITAKTFVMAGASDTTANPSSVASYYQTLPNAITRALATYRGATHLDWIGSGNKARQARFKTMITSWLKVHLVGDSAYATYLDVDGVEHKKQIAADWYTRYEYKK
jgi:dienelactone hydrolase